EEKDEKDGAMDMEAAQQLYDKNCASCHGAEGGGGIGPSLKDKKYKYGRSLDAITESIANGRPGGMPAFGNQFSQKQIESLAAFVRDEL
ncbi:MAG: cytochrome c, partial [Desulfuromonadales bacterium]|nr:cytochrome c [Desulfuromonadales bacterium]NIS42568.1 cytochrome c [Desulfuromonadales bacterium]